MSVQLCNEVGCGKDCLVLLVDKSEAVLTVLAEERRRSRELRRSIVPGSCHAMSVVEDDVHRTHDHVLACAIVEGLGIERMVITDLRTELDIV